MFHLSSRPIKLTIERCYVIPTNKRYALGLDPFLQAGCNKAIHITHDNVTFKINDEETCIHMSVASNYVDHTKLEIILPIEYDVNKMDKEVFTPEIHKCVLMRQPSALH